MCILFLVSPDRKKYRSDVKRKSRRYVTEIQERASALMGCGHIGTCMYELLRAAEILMVEKQNRVC